MLAPVGCTSISRAVVIQAADLREQMRREVAEHEAAHRRSAQLLAEAQVYSIQLYIAPAVYYTVYSYTSLYTIQPLQHPSVFLPVQRAA